MLWLCHLGLVNIKAFCRDERVSEVVAAKFSADNVSPIAYAKMINPRAFGRIM